jgi:hypothetical protein
VQIKLIPDCPEVIVELRALAGGKRQWPMASTAWKLDFVFGFDPTRATAHHDHSIRHTNGFPNIVGHEYRRLFLVTQNSKHIV